jgi:CheY-like chemotaxis protein
MIRATPWLGIGATDPIVAGPTITDASRVRSGSLEYRPGLGRMPAMENIEDIFGVRRADRTDRAGRDASRVDVSAAMVLVVEDDSRAQACARQLVTRAIDPRDVNVAIAPSAEDAIVLLRSFVFDVVVSDYRLGDSDGGQVLEHVRIHLPRMLDRFVFFSGSEEPGRLLPGRVIDKGVSPDRFISDLRRMIPEDVRGVSR